MILNCFCYFYYTQKAVKFNVDFYSFNFVILYIFIAIYFKY
ncbi:hypothetical protein DORFOR_01991 [Dorea formicigenerans ATCC 27755]|uniref:Uncharacterized protein n=1 Tax=Dorea formicigenerans ATCC 27755 TaxID=411461 RepID=B0G6K7_9FIRM|nr:hypothetical protein DORFOR_01991 [Dorea formicigenerans ATCC 27755]